MRKVPDEILISCQLSFYPLGRDDILPDIQKVLGIIQSSGLNHSVGDMSTVLSGSLDTVFSLIRNIAASMDADGCKFAMNVTLSNTCGID